MFAALLSTVALAAAPGFSTHIDNPFWPMRPGTRWIYRETAPGAAPQRDVVTVTRRTKRVAAGATVRVVHDRATAHGKLVEDTFDYYAQHRRGNVWYLGEATTEYENGRPVSTAGSWEAGVDGARPGIVMLAHPRVGRRYREENYPGHALDGAQVMSRREQAEVPYGHFRRVLFTKNFNPLEPRSLEYKFYARRIGPVLEVGISGDDDRAELVRFRRGRG